MTHFISRTSLMHATQPGLQQWMVVRTSATASEERSATHLVYDAVKGNGFVWICT